MAVRRPLYGISGNLREMTSGEVTQIVNEVIRLYGNDPGVTLEVTNDNPDASGFEQKLATLSDNRLRASAAASAGYRWPSPNAADYITVQYNRTLQSLNWRSAFPYKDRSGSTYANHSYPVYYDSSGFIKAMSWVDIRDTFIEPAIDRLTSSSTAPSEAAGTYFISTSQSETDATLVSSTAVYTDTQADITEFASGSLPETRDQINTSETVNYYLHQVNTLPEADFTLPVVLWPSGDGNLRTIQRSRFRNMLADLIKYWTTDPANAWDSAIRYQYNTSSGHSSAGFELRGTGLANKYTTTYTERRDQNRPNPNASVYYAQNVPTGTPTAQTTYYLGIGQT